MKTIARSFLSATALLTAAYVQTPALAACSHATTIRNDSGVTLRIAELKSSSSLPVFKSQWSGSRVISPGASGTISWTSDLNCTDSGGVVNHWDIKLVRNIGTVHYCGFLTAGQNVRVDSPDLCFPD